MLLDHLFLDLDFHKLYGEIAEDNIEMIKTRDYLGYHRIRVAARSLQFRSAPSNA
ncbi:MAG: hypothetical protein R3C26_00160 [Calditrichia bacterium]